MAFEQPVSAPTPKPSAAPDADKNQQLIEEQLKFDHEKELAQQRLDHGGMAAYKSRMSERNPKKKEVPATAADPASPAPEKEPAPPLQTPGTPSPFGTAPDASEAPDARDRPSLAKVLLNKDKTGW